MSVFWGFLVGIIAGAIAYAILAMPAFGYLGGFASLISILVAVGVGYTVYRHLEGRGKVL